MRNTYSNFPPDQLIVVCGVLESTLISIINDLESNGHDVTKYRTQLNEAHMALDELVDQMYMLTEFEQKKLDDYFDPAKAWDRYCDAQDAAYKEEYENSCCADCRHCRVPDGKYYSDPNVAFCPAWVDDFIYTTDKPADYECEDFELPQVGGQ